MVILINDRVLLNRVETANLQSYKCLYKTKMAADAILTLKEIAHTNNNLIFDAILLPVTFTIGPCQM